MNILIFPSFGTILVCIAMCSEIYAVRGFMSRVMRVLRHWVQETKGAVMVEFALVCLVVLLIVAGIMDLGHAFFMNQVITNASREGARYGVVYATDTSGNRLKPNQLSPTIQVHLLGTGTGQYNLPSLLPTDANAQVIPGGAGYTSGLSGDALTVQVTAIKNWWVLDNFIPGFGGTKTLSAKTVMRLE
jgi:Flp pilus assembly pilin Flp